MRSPRTIALWSLLLMILTAWGMPRPDDDQLSVRDPVAFGDWFASPDQVTPLYRTLKPSDASPRSPWTVDSAASRLELVFGGSDGELHRVPLRIEGTVEVDSRNLGLSAGSMRVRIPEAMRRGLPHDAVEVEIGPVGVGTAPREPGSKAAGGMVLWLSFGDTRVEFAGMVTVHRLDPDRLEVVVDGASPVSLPELGLGAVLETLKSRFGVEWVEKEGAVRSRVVLRRSQAS